MARRSQKPTKSEKILRVDMVYGMLCDGMSRAAILQKCADLWEVKVRTGDNYIAEARLKLEDDCRITRESLMAEAFAAYRQIRQSAENRGQMMAALKAVENMTALAGLNK